MDYTISSYDTSWAIISSGVTTNSALLSSLDIGKIYALKVEARNAHGLGEPSYINLTTGTPPSKPNQVSLFEFNDTSLTLAWTVPINTGFNTADPSLLLQWQL